MSYIDIINRFWSIDLEANFSHLEVHVFFKLLEINNRLGWKERFKYPNSRIEAEIGSRPKNLINARQRLVDFNIISYKKGTTRVAGTYSFNVLGNESKRKENRATPPPPPPSTQFQFKHELLQLIQNEELVSDFMKVRKLKKASNTKTAFNALIKQFELSGLTPEECVQIAVEHDWKSFKASWLKNMNDAHSKRQPGIREERNSRQQEALDNLAARLQEADSRAS